MPLWQLLFSDHSTDNMGIPTVPDRVPATLHGESGEPSDAAGETKSNWGSTASATAKLLLRGVRESADAFGPLKSVAGGLCFIVENFEVWSPPACTVRRLQVRQQTKANAQEIESLAPRVKALAELLCAPVSEGDIKEGARREDLQRYARTFQNVRLSLTFRDCQEIGRCPSRSGSVVKTREGSEFRQQHQERR